MIYKGARVNPLFLSTLPAWGATKTVGLIGQLALFLSTLPAWGATRRPFTPLFSRANFYPRSPRGERPQSICSSSLSVRFLSTLPAWGATGPLPGGEIRLHNFYPRSPRGERLTPTGGPGSLWVISIHAPRVGSDIHDIIYDQGNKNFYPRSPRGERRET